MGHYTVQHWSRARAYAYMHIRMYMFVHTQNYLTCGILIQTHILAQNN